MIISSQSHTKDGNEFLTTNRIKIILNISPSHKAKVKRMCLINL